jgi:hypothetical protein
LTEGIENRLTELTSSRQIASNTTKQVSALSSAKTTGHFLLDLEHTNIAFRQIVIEGDVKMTQKSQNGRFIVDKTLDEITLRRLLEPTAFERLKRRRWIKRRGGLNNPVITALKSHALKRRKS